MEKIISFRKSVSMGSLVIAGMIAFLSFGCLLGGFSAVTPNSGSLPTATDFNQNTPIVTPLASQTELGVTQVAAPTSTIEVTPFLPSTDTLTPDPIQDIRARFQNPELMLYEEYDLIEVVMAGEILKIDIIRREGDSWGYESLQDISYFLHLGLVDCTEYRFGHGIDGCKIKEAAPYKHVELREYLPSGDLQAYVRFTVGNESYFAGFDGTQIIESRIFEIADESFLQP